MGIGRGLIKLPSVKIFQVTFKIKPADEGFWERLPGHRAWVARHLQEEILLTYAVAGHRERGWAVVRGESAEAVMDLVSESPLDPYLEHEIEELMLYENPASHFPKLGLN